MKNKNRFLEVLALIVLGLVLYIALGNEWTHLDVDSEGYLHIATKEGVMPLFPLFLRLIKCLVGESIQTTVAVVLQGLLAVISTLVFTLFIKDSFSLKTWETILVYLLCAVPFYIYFPDYVVTHQILTEGLTYSLYYLFLWQIFKAVKTRRIRNILGVLIVSIVLGLTRTQLMLCVPFAALVIWRVVYVGFKKKGSGLIRFLLTGILAGVIAILGVILVQRTYTFYLDKITVQLSEEKRVEVAYNGDARLLFKDIDRDSYEIVENANVVWNSLVFDYATGQLGTVAMIKGFYEADEDDWQLFDTPEEQEVFKCIYADLEKYEYLYKYAKPGLYMWQDLVKDRIPLVVVEGMADYCRAHPEVQMNVYISRQDMALTLLKAHWGRALYHFLRLEIMSLIASVFFQVERVYALCHVITLIIYAMFIFGIWYSVKKKADSFLAECAVILLGFILIMTGGTNVLFIGFQRYVVYNIGVFYILLYLMVGKDILNRLIFRNASEIK